MRTSDSSKPSVVKFSLERYRGGGATALKERVAGVDVVDAQRVRIRLRQPWADFMTFYGTPATGAASLAGLGRTYAPTRGMRAAPDLPADDPTDEGAAR